jgi:hypothetical protein
MSRLFYRLDKIEKSLERRKVKASVVIIQPGETQKQAIDRDGAHDDARYLLIIDTHRNYESIDAQIEKTIQELRKAGVSDAEINQVIQA